MYVILVPKLLSVKLDVYKLILFNVRPFLQQCVASKVANILFDNGDYDATYGRFKTQ